MYKEFQKGMVRDNVFYDTYAEVVNCYDCEKEVWEEAQTIVLLNTDNTIGLFPNTDIICVYNAEDGKPSIITERIQRKNYTWLEWRRLTSYLHKLTRVVAQELGFNIKISYAKDYCDFIHYKEEWWQWAIKTHSSK